VRRQHFQSGDVIFAEGDPSAYAYVLEQGRVEIFREDGDDRWVLGSIGVGEIFGEMGLVDERPRSAGALVTDDAVVSAVTGDEFVQLLFDNSADGVRYLKALFERLRTTNERARESVLRPSQLQQASQVVTKAESIALVSGLTAHTQRIIPLAGRSVKNWPFRVGRAASGVLGDNHLELPDQQPFSVSRNHFLIDRSGGDVVVRDRGSYLGTIVNGEKIGGRRSNGEAVLQQGDNTVIAGDSSSPYRFNVRIGD
jgi:CRP/FNR family transcriptional regulator, cyclic AMP receptor protein